MSDSELVDSLSGEPLTIKSIKQVMGLLTRGGAHPDAVMEHAVALADAPAEPTPARPEWTLLDAPPGGVMALLGMDDGRTSIGIAMQGQWRPNDFKSVKPLDPDRIGEATSHVYRHSYDGARRIEVLFDDEKRVWYANKGRAVKPSEAGRATPVLHQEEYERAMLEMARTLVEQDVAGEDPEERAQRVWNVLKMVSKHSFQRGWKELGFGFFS